MWLGVVRIIANWGFPTEKNDSLESASSTTEDFNISKKGVQRHSYWFNQLLDLRQNGGVRLTRKIHMSKIISNETYLLNTDKSLVNN